MCRRIGFSLIIKNKTKQQQKLPRRGKTGQLTGLSRQDRTGQGRAGQGRAGQGRAGQGRAGQGRAGQGKARQGKARQGKARQGKARQGKAHARGTYDEELAQDCKHKEIIKGANEEGNEERQVGQMNQ